MNILVTGAAGNLGTAIVDRFLAGGHTVVGFDTFQKGDFPKGGLSKRVEVDLADEMHTQLAVGRMIVEFGGIDVAVLTAGGFAMGSIAETGSAQLMQQYRLNFETAYNAARPVFLHMMERKKGRIFLVGARPATDMKQAKGMTAYALSKSLIFRLAELLNEEAKGTDVVVTVIVPSIIDTPQNRSHMPEASWQDWMKPEQMAEIIYFYTTPEASGLREPVLKMYNKA
jgi:NAD(P)-dependent dehydrogenase (short-subunit alcohol dehydrogenase family)